MVANGCSVCVDAKTLCYYRRTASRPRDSRLARAYLLRVCLYQAAQADFRGSSVHIHILLHESSAQASSITKSKPKLVRSDESTTKGSIDVMHSC